MDEQVTILHTNDIHSHFENWPRIQRYLLTEREQRRQSGSHVITVDLGDAVDRAHPLSEATQGQANVALLNGIGYDAVTIGNNEGLGLTHGALNQLYDRANFDVILDNLTDTATHLPPRWALPAKIITTARGTRILLLAFTAPFTLTYPLNGWTPASVKTRLPELLRQYAGQYDVLIVMSHLGINVDRWLAKQFPVIDVVIGSHTHHLLVNGELKNGVLIAAAGKYGEYIGQIELTIDGQHHVKTVVAHTVATASLPIVTGDEALIAGWKQQGETLLTQQVVAKVPQQLRPHWHHASDLTALGLAAITDYAKTDLGMLNGGLFMRDLPAGIVNQNDLHTMLPHAMHVIRVTLSGEALWRLVYEMELVRPFLNKFPIKGMGFRGQVFGYIQYQGLAWEAEQHGLLVNGQPVDRHQTYQIALLDHDLFIPFFPTINISGRTEILFEAMLRTVVGDYLARQWPVK
ncbi:MULTISPECIES: bifunctional metallophosphatase/5'-nucleotidase [Lactiplantibacillus]|uniref:bifunctional metallophosphatase/5'-nucleotidase n=1 Tax=Lactiplantibacillus TaxID=2767842 RepID=UPI0006BEE73D|nr:bifunctional UDP-sugar hydrolase/5'-nucleotidase [Lactiplantibacillus plantarum]AYC71564.1 bifunctional metallophosphatase/5'-nucleotidase [Lactiplantibacillus plantarum]KON39143.1 5'-nucleotidase [Lactiplantibacillus plantarum]RDG00664.1 bifunctional metallophosphatase/5'-nucleotidase [Lactiplantibacillus plantarum]